MLKQIKSFEIREDADFPKVYIDGELYENCGVIKTIDIDPIGGFSIGINYMSDPPLISNNTLLLSTDTFYIPLGEINDNK